MLFENHETTVSYNNQIHVAYYRLHPEFLCMCTTPEGKHTILLLTIRSCSVHKMKPKYLGIINLEERRSKGKNKSEKLLKNDPKSLVLFFFLAIVVG